MIDSVARIMASPWAGRIDDLARQASARMLAGDPSGLMGFLRHKHHQCGPLGRSHFG